MEGTEGARGRMLQAGDSWSKGPKTTGEEGCYVGLHEDFGFNSG